MTPAQLSAAFAAAAERIRNSETLMRAISLIAERAGKAHAPVRTGALRRDIAGRADSQAAYVGNSLHYARYVHDGTSRMAARPYLQEGIADASGEIESEAARYVESILASISGGGG